MIDSQKMLNAGIYCIKYPNYMRYSHFFDKNDMDTIHHDEYIVYIDLDRIYSITHNIPYSSIFETIINFQLVSSPMVLQIKYECDVVAFNGTSSYPPNREDMMEQMYKRCHEYAMNRYYKTLLEAWSKRKLELLNIK